MKAKINEVVNQIIDWSDDSSGTVLSKQSIEKIVLLCSYRHYKVDRDQIDILIEKFESESGYLVKALDFISIFNSIN